MQKQSLRAFQIILAQQTYRLIQCRQHWQKRSVSQIMNWQVHLKSFPQPQMATTWELISLTNNSIDNFFSLSDWQVCATYLILSTNSLRMHHIISIKKAQKLAWRLCNSTVTSISCSMTSTMSCWTSYKPKTTLIKFLLPFMNFLDATVSAAVVICGHLSEQIHLLVNNFNYFVSMYSTSHFKTWKNTPINQCTIINPSSVLDVRALWYGNSNGCIVC